MAEDLLRVFNKYRYDRSIETKTRNWFQQQVTLLAKKPIMPGLLLRQEHNTNVIVPGSLYMFYYDPKYKEQLPYYDRFPMVFPYKKMADGFMGLNLHYLPNYWRVKLFVRLMDFATNKSLDEKTRIKYSWSLIGSMSKFDIATPCIKHYLTEHVKSMFIQIKPSDWHTAMMLPTERFVKADKRTVWEDAKPWLH